MTSKDTEIKHKSKKHKEGSMQLVIGIIWFMSCEMYFCNKRAEIFHLFLVKEMIHNNTAFCDKSTEHDDLW